MPRHRRLLFGRLALLAGVLIALVLIAGPFRSVGLSEFALVLALAALVLAVESARFVIARFLKGLRGDR